jgi:hypothetical protein
MRPGSWCPLWVLVTWTSLAGAVTAPAATAERAYSLQYHAVAGCPDAAALVHAIESRTPGAMSGPESAAVNLRVELREDGTSTLWVELPEGLSRREFPPATCADAVASIAVIASMVLEADISQRRATVDAVMGDGAPEQPDQTPPKLDAPTIAPTLPSAPARDVAGGTTTRARQPAQRSQRRRSSLGFALTAGPLLESAVAENAAWGANAGIAAWREPRRPSVWVPSVQAEALATLPTTVQASRGDVELRLLVGRLHVCPLRFLVGSRLRLVPCLTGDLGVLRARGTGQTVDPEERNMPWLALGSTFRAQLALGRALGLESWLGLRGLARADRFVFSNPDLLAYQVPQWSLGAGLGLSLALP